MKKSKKKRGNKRNTDNDSRVDERNDVTEIDGPIRSARLVNEIPSTSRGITEVDVKVAQEQKPTVPEVRSTLMVTDKHAHEYNMNHKNRGKAIIFNHENFENKEPTRIGTQVDAGRLKETLQKLHFEVEVHNDLDFSSLRKTINSLKDEDHSENDCLLVVVLSHGQESSQVSACDVYYPIDYLWEPFTASECLTLAGKPKIFIVNACRGSQVDEGVKMVSSGPGITVTDSVAHSYKIPKHADFLVAQSTVEGYYSYRDTEEGTWFVKCLCDVLEEYHETTDLLKMLTITSRRVAVNFMSNIPDIPEMHEMTQVPSITTRLIRDVYFKPKNSQE